MYTEIEAKLKVHSLEEVDRKLRDSGASVVRETVQTDCYFDMAGRDLTGSDKALRLRRDKTGAQEHFILTYKGPKQKDDYKKRVEIELDVNDAEAAERLLAELGYHKALAFNKKRRLWKLHDCEVALDELPLLGVFVEIEGPDSETISRVQEMLGLAEAPHIMDSYACLIDAELSRLGRESREVYL